jgi:tetratricopeptide (TPR) repeat protein
MRSYASAVLILLSICGLGSSRPPAQSSPYRELVDSYRERGADTKALLAMPRDAVVAAVDNAVSKAGSWQWQDLRAAAMLHSETCIAAATSGSTCEFHIMQAQRLLERTVALSPAQEDFAWRWYHVMPRMLSALGQKSLARGIDTLATEKWRLDRARATYLQGLELESRGAHATLFQGTSGPNSYDRTGARAGYFAQAAELFTRALKYRSDLTVAALHLGRIRMLQGNAVEAAASFRSALTDVDPAVRYLTALFLGTLEERDQHFDAAERLYRDALGYVPYGQSAPLALSELLSRTGREADARRVLAARLLRVDTEILEPFWAYGSEDVPSTRFDLLRVEVWK